MKKFPVGKELTLLSYEVGLLTLIAWTHITLMVWYHSGGISERILKKLILKRLSRRQKTLLTEVHLLITFANSLDPDQARQNAGPDLYPNCLTL